MSIWLPGRLQCHSCQSHTTSHDGHHDLLTFTLPFQAACRFVGCCASRPLALHAYAMLCGYGPLPWTAALGCVAYSAWAACCLRPRLPVHVHPGACASRCMCIPVHVHMGVAQAHPRQNLSVLVHLLHQLAQIVVGAWHGGSLPVPSQPTHWTGLDSHV